MNEGNKRTNQKIKSVPLEKKKKAEVEEEEEKKGVSTVRPCSRH